MEDSAIKKEFENLKLSTTYDLLYEVTLYRERADWLVGINVTRLFHDYIISYLMLGG